MLPEKRNLDHNPNDTMKKQAVPALLLQQILEKRGTSKRQFAKLLNIQYPAVFEYFRPDYNPKLSTLTKFALALNCKIRDLIDER
jgi:predicted transcriptional regulator